jgi:hypothetical protein
VLVDGEELARYESPPRPRSTSGENRRVGLEIELGNLSIEETLAVVRETLGGEVALENPSKGEVRGTPFGTFEVELDAKALKERSYLHTLESLGVEPGSAIAERFEESVLRIARELVPIEIVAPPVDVRRLEALDPLWVALRRAGAEDTHDSILYAFGLHLNPELPDLEPGTTLSILKSYLLLEDWIVEVADIDLSRRVAPYIRPFPEGYRRAVLSDDRAPDWNEIIRTYVDWNPTRNRPLDLLPLFAEVSDLDFADRIDTWHLVKARPTFHYRLPNCELARRGWSPAIEWNRWVAVERLANAPHLLAELSAEYLATEDQPLRMHRAAWAEHVAGRLAAIEASARAG